MPSEGVFSKASKFEQDLKWARILFRKFADFHQRTNGLGSWDFYAQQLTDFLRSRRDQKTPAWQRMKILEGVMNYRRLIQERGIDFLRPIHEKMKEVVI